MKIFKIVEDGFYKKFLLLGFCFFKYFNQKKCIDKYEALFDRVCKLDACYNIEKSLSSRYLTNLYFTGESILPLLQKEVFCRQNPAPEVLLMYINCLYETGEEELALVGLKDYVSKYGLHLIEEFGFVAIEAKKHDFTNEIITKAAVVYEHIYANLKERNFYNYLGDKSVAVVGNSDCVLDRDDGAEIDAHDVVIRMNGYFLDTYEKELGTKVNVFATNANFEIITIENNYKKYDWVFIAMDIFHLPLSKFVDTKNFIELWYGVIESGGKIVSLDFDISRNIRKDSKLTVCSTGCKVWYSLYKCGIKFDLYGFMQPQQGEIILNRFADKNRSAARIDLKECLSASLFFRNTEFWDSGHDFGKEMAFRKRILGV